jgi:hypothetical protein
MLVNGLHMLNFAIESSTGSGLGVIQLKGSLPTKASHRKSERLIDSLDKLVFAITAKRPSTMQ